MIKSTLLLASLCAALAVQPGFAQSPSAPGAKPLAITAAHAWTDPAHSLLLDAAYAGSRIVAVGEHGIVLLSDNGGETYRQASAVPASTTLTAVHFANARDGWAVGHWGAILATTDGGEHWTLQRSDPSIDQPLFSVYFKDAVHGWAAGLWSLLLATNDGGKTWTRVALPAPPGGGKADRNLYHLFADSRGVLFVVAEQGLVLRSRDDGASWEYRETGNKGSLWAGTVAPDGSVLVGGLLGHLYRSTDDGDTWTPLDSGSSGSITALGVAGGQVIGVGLDGFVIRGTPDAAHFAATQRPDRAALTAVLTNPRGVPILLSKDGILKPQ
ncbi:hypothetical protein DSC91_001954 [Paraburkholderia caffeinilytica]|uniref:Photosynthesis system II assembly factor Ycf48/Hcf136-like domain-containing protein n=1 Tax=Paraburkholderia caffeinilytica TaxID=1761016 RepID=A0ABQ1MIE7_9BURK|nr:YCF48-related protein [Paraburkholderia caffeinilytica]AXL49953.1 hypothetical protein DSC91_001954 [Paraburkholderia caffeinilytica]GGC39135.1 hypothetical protein GCM10011400_27300 [Paraburkholderia caffeinilytica]CAB3786445.1 Ycf48-like protein [Paraburkholderia caffeinilytica]